MRRHRSLVKSTKGSKFPVNRADWSKPEYLKQMYDVIYEVFIESGIGRKLETPVAYNKQGEILCSENSSEEQYGETSDIIIDLPDHLLFADETSVNTSMKDDGNCGGEKVSVENNNSKARVLVSTSENRATVFPVTAATGEPVVCVVIFCSMSSRVSCCMHTGIDIKKTPQLDSTGIPDWRNKENHGPGKYFPGGPVCNFRGKRIETLTYSSPSGSISSEILTDIFKYLDSLKLYSRENDTNISLLFYR